VNRWDRLLAAPGAGPLLALAAWQLTPWIARARLARIERRRGRPLQPDEHVNWQVWGHAGCGHGRLWRTFLAEWTAPTSKSPCDAPPLSTKASTTPHPPKLCASREFRQAPPLGSLARKKVRPGLDGLDIEGYAKLSLKKYRPIAARNDDRNVFSGLL
jgi:hypothetical protein